MEELINNKLLLSSIHETQRLIPPIPFAVGRLITSEIAEFDGFKVRKGDTVWFVHGGINENPKYFENANKFIPERFMNEEWVKSIPRQYNIPFGAGKRSCQGKYFAMKELPIYLGSLIKHFEFKLPDQWKSVLSFNFGYRKDNATIMVKIRNA